MDNKSIRTWEQSLEQSESSPITANLPKEAPSGAIFRDTGNDGIVRTWVRVEIVSGVVGGRWAYWHSWRQDIGRIGVGVIADRIFNGDAAHFAGMLGTPHNGEKNVLGWLMIDPKATPPEREKFEVDKPDTRYERSREIYDVETGTTTKI